MSTVSYTCSYTSRTDARKSLCNTFCNAANLVTGTSPARQKYENHVNTESSEQDDGSITFLELFQQFDGSFDVCVKRAKEKRKKSENIITTTTVIAVKDYSPFARFKGSPVTAMFLRLFESHEITIKLQKKKRERPNHRLIFDTAAYQARQ